MINAQKISKATASAYVNDKSKIISMLNESGAKIKPTATNEKVINVLEAFITSNKKFAEKFTTFLFKKGYLRKEDVQIDPSNLNAHSNYTGYLNAEGTTETNTTKTASEIGGAVAGGWWTAVVDTVGGVFKRPEVDTETVSAIVQLEREKLKSQQQSSNVGKKIFIGGVIVGLVGITGLVILKLRKK